MKQKTLSPTTGGLKLCTVKQLLFLVFFIPAISFAQEKVTWDFPVKPGSNEWKELKNQKEKLDVCQIPDEVLKNIPTDELMELCFDYPLIYDILAFNSTQAGIDQFRKNFNGFSEFIQREEAPGLLMERYSNLQPRGYNKNWTNIEKGYFSLELIAAELFLSQNEIISKLSTSKKKGLVKELIKKLEEKDDKELYGGLSKMSIGFALARVMQSAGYNLKGIDDKTRNEIESFTGYGNLQNIQILSYIFSNAKEFIK